jgi:hypothetical protein
MNLMQGTPLQSQFNNLLNNLKVTYLNLFGGKLWSGITATPQQSSFLDENEIKDAQAMVAKNQPTMGQMGETICPVPPLQRKRTHPSSMP